MNRKQKIEINYSKERVVLSDILPYETPLTFSNRHFYRFLKDNVKYMEDDNAILNEIDIIKKNTRLSATRKSELIIPFEVLKAIKQLMFFKNGKAGMAMVTKPLCYKILHKENDFRELSVIHPKNQLAVVNFYNKYKDLIIYYANISPYSIRKPHKVARYVFHNDKLHESKKDIELDRGNPEQYDSEYENLKSYFSVKKYNNIHKFFESYQFHRSEKKYNNLYKFDVSKCFDSIYTHTIVWALFNKEIVKNNIPESLASFGGEFDFLMQKLNSNETNGIVIGPEFSRIFAELILQQIDKNVHQALFNKKEEKDCLIHKRDYDVFRYVDDYFIFYNNESTKDEILKEFKIKLKEYKLGFNDAKSLLYHKPIITEISIAKQLISDLFRDHLKLKIKEIENELISEATIAIEQDEKEDTGVDTEKSVVYFSSNHVITRFKIIIKQTGVEYKDIMNFTLAALDKNVASIIKKHKTVGEVKNKENIFLNAFLQIIDVAFFLYSVSPRVNSTIKICMISEKIIMFLKKNKENSYTEPFNISNKHLVYKKISDEIFLILQKNKSSKFIQVESLYLLICLSQLGREYRLDLKNICDYFDIRLNQSKKYEFYHELNYFSITVLLFYIKNLEQYSELKEPIKDLILSKFEGLAKENWRSDTELTLLLFDVLTCPFLEVDILKHPTYKKYKAATTIADKKKYKKQYLDIKYTFKKKLLSLNGITNSHINIIEKQKFWFTKWTDFEFGKELEAKKSLEVYS